MRKSYLVTWAIDLDAETHREAVVEALERLRDPDTTALVFRACTKEEEDAGTFITVDLVENTKEKVVDSNSNRRRLMGDDTMYPSSMYSGGSENDFDELRKQLAVKDAEIVRLSTKGLDEIFRLQSELNDKTFRKQQQQDLYHPHFPPLLSCGSRSEYSFTDVCALPWHHPLRQYWIGKFMQACFAELGEMHETTAWKWWQSTKAVVGLEPQSDELDGSVEMERLQEIEKSVNTLQNARIEGIDTLHFLVSLFLLMGLDADGAFRMYVGKHQVNQQRQDSGYTEKTDDDTHI